MSTWIKVLLGAALGFGGGFAAGYFYHKKASEVEIEEEIQTVKEEDLEGSKVTDVEKEGAANAALPFSSLQDLPEDPDKARLALQGKKSYLQADMESKMAYAKVWDTVNGYSSKENADNMPIEEDVEEGLDEEFLEMIEKEEVEPGQVEPPHVISLAEFYNERPEYDKITIEYYEPDDTFLDERDEVIADINAYVGDIDVKKLFKEESPDGDPDSRFVRNERYGSDYEIIRYHRSYNETTGGRI